MNQLELLKSYFRTGTTEGELQLLDRTFVYDPCFVAATAPPQGSPRLLVGKKGAGKTALVEYLQLRLESSGVPVVLLRPDDFDLGAIGASSDLAAIKRSTYAFLTLAIAHRLSIKGALATGHKRVLNEAARGYDKGKLDAVQKLLKILIPIGKAISQVDFSALLPDNVPRPIEVASAIRGELGEVQRVAYVVIDDTDQVGGPHESNYLARIWGLLLGVRRLASEVANLKCIITLRTEVWRRLRWDPRGQRDQVDHFNPLVVHWMPTDEQIRRIWMRRMELAACDADDPIQQFFETKEVILPNTESQQRLWADFLVKSARERPRDVIQLMGKLIDRAVRCNDDRIASRHMDAVIAEYSSERVDCLQDEFVQDCAALRDMVRTLASLGNVIDAEELMRHLQGIPSAFSVTVRGRVLAGDRRDDAFIIWSLLHEAGVLNGLVPDVRMPRLFRHINYADDQGLVSSARWNDMQGMKWELHPAFRSYVQGIRDNEKAAEGMSSKEILSRRRTTKP